MNEFRISKYDLKYRINGVYQKEEWISIGDVGRVYDGSVFTFEEYVRVENAYLSFIEKVCQTLNIQSLNVMGLEDYNHICKFAVEQIVDLDEILDISRDCLRERYWCRLESKQLFFHFGYDYYLYVGSKLTYSHIKCMTDSCGLYVEKMESPYKKK